MFYRRDLAIGRREVVEVLLKLRPNLRYVIDVLIELLEFSFCERSRLLGRNLRQGRLRSMLPTGRVLSNLGEGEPDAKQDLDEANPFDIVHAERTILILFSHRAEKADLVVVPDRTNAYSGFFRKLTDTHAINARPSHVREGQGKNGHSPTPSFLLDRICVG